MPLPSPAQVNGYQAILADLEKFLWNNPTGGTYWPSDPMAVPRLEADLLTAGWVSKVNHGGIGDPASKRGLDITPTIPPTLGS